MSAKPPAPDGTDGGFLARWSRRKQQAGEQPDPTPAATTPTPAPAPAPAVDEEPEVPLEELPPLDSIDANTDLAPLLKRRLPPAWRQAALRRVWAADPAIRGFKGLAEYDWDFNIGGDAPGFGPLRSPADAKLLLARMLGTAAPESTDQEAAPPTAPLGADEAPQAAAPAPSAQNSEPPAHVAVQNDLSLPTSAQNDKEEQVKPRQRRRGGSAAPR